MFIVRCRTCRSRASFDEYAGADEWRRDHATDDHPVTMAYLVLDE